MTLWQKVFLWTTTEKLRSKILIFLSIVLLALPWSKVSNYNQANTDTAKKRNEKLKTEKKAENRGNINFSVHIIISNETSHNRTLSILGMSATTALTTSAAAAAMPLTMMTTATTTTSAASANSEIISPTMSFNAFNLQSMQNANSLGHLSSRKDYYARTDLTFLVVFPLLFLAFNLCYWISLLFWRKDEEDIHLDWTINTFWDLRGIILGLFLTLKLTGWLLRHIWVKILSTERYTG